MAKNDTENHHLSRSAQRLAALKGNDISALGMDPSQMMSREGMEKMARKHGGAQANEVFDKARQVQDMIGQAQGMAQNGLDFKQMSQMASQMGVDGQAGAFLKQLSETDPERAGEIPGMVVDKKTGKVKLFGLDGLEVPQQFAAGMAAAYTWGLGYINKFAWDKGYKAGMAATKPFNLSEAARGKIGVAAAYGAIAATTHWIDINRFIQNEQDYRKDYETLARRLAPVLDDIKDGNHSVNALFRVSKDDNEVIYNERRRMHTLNNAERVQTATFAAGRAVQFLMSAVEGHDQKGAHGYQEDVMNRSYSKSEKKYRGTLAKAQKLVEENKGLSLDKAVDMVQETGEKGEFAKVMETVVPVASTYVAQMVGNSLLGARTDNIPEISAYDLIMTLKKQLDDDLESPRYALPKGASVANGKSGDANALTLTQYIMQIFDQHERDCSPDGRVSKRMQDRLLDVSKEISKALRSGDMDAMALVGLVGERKLVLAHGKRIANEETVEREISRYKDKMSHVEIVDEDKFFADVTFTPKELREVWDALADEERDAFVGMVPSPILESVGVESRDIQTRKERRKDQFANVYVRMVEGILELKPEEAKELEITPGEKKLLERANTAIAKDGLKGIEHFMPHKRSNGDDLSSLLAGVVVNHVSHGGKVCDLVQHSGPVKS